jgi:hypothetical protein
MDLRAREKITSHFKSRCIPAGGVVKTRQMKDMPAFSRLAGRAPQLPTWRTYFCANPKMKTLSHYLIMVLMKHQTYPE